MSDDNDKTVGYGDLVKEESSKEDTLTKATDRFVLSRTEPVSTASGDLNVERSEDLEEKIIEKLEQHDGRIQSDPLIGTVVAERFKIEARIGSGGMGAVYRAEQIGMERRIALKVLRPEYSNNEGVRRRFHLEALAASRLTHPNTIRIYDFGETDDKVLYIAMEFLRGRGLSTVLGTDKVLSAHRLIHLISKVCESLAEAHRNKVVHRDLKPDNIFLCVVEDDPEYVKVLDFGVAKIITDANQGRAGTLTEAGHLFGTPRYMAPEQCRSELVDGRTDIYALGVIMFQCLTGTLPFNDESPIAIMMWHLQREPPGFIHVSPTIRVPEALEAVVQRCMKKDPHLRFSSVEKLRLALEEVAETLGEEWQSVQRRGPEELEGMDLSEAQTALAYPQDERTQVAPIRPKTGLKSSVLVRIAFVLMLGSALGSYLFIRSGTLPEPQLPNLSSIEVPIQELSKTIPALTHRVQVLSIPSGAEVWEGETSLGSTPVLLKRRPGDEVIFSLRLKGYESAKVSSDFANKDQKLSVELKKRLPAQTKPVRQKKVPGLKPYRPQRLKDFKSPGQ